MLWLEHKRMNDLGHNQPPGMIDTAAEVTAQVNAWLTDHPVIEASEEASSAKALIDRAKLCLKDLDDEREGKVKPLNSQIQQINNEYRSPRNLLSRILDEAKRRVTDYIAREEAKRIKEAEKARIKAEEAARLALEAEQREQEARSDANAGVVVDVGGTIEAADVAFSDYRRAERTAARAERETKVKVGGGFSRALSLREKETLRVKDPHLALRAIGMTPHIEEAILKGARAFRTLHNELPAGIEVTVERKI